MLSRTSFDLPGAGSLIFPAYLVSAHHNARRSVNSEYTVISMDTYNTHTHTQHQLGLRGFRPPFSSVGRKIQAWGTRSTLVLPLARKRQGAYNNTSRKTRKRVGLVPACRLSLLQVRRFWSASAEQDARHLHRGSLLQESHL